MRHEASLNGGTYRLFKFSKFGFSIIDIEKAIMKKAGPVRYHYYLQPPDDEEEPEPLKDKNERKQRHTIRHPMTYARIG